MEGRGLEKEEFWARREVVGEEEGVRSVPGGEGTVSKPAESVGGLSPVAAGEAPNSSTNLQTEMDVYSLTGISYKNIMSPTKSLANVSLFL